MENWVLQLAGDNMHSSIKKLTLSESKDSISKLNPDFARIVDKLPLQDEHSLFLARYSYGSQILHDGVLCFPSASGDLVPLDDKNTDKLVRKAFNGIRFFPMYLCSHNHIEVSFDYPKVNLPVSILSPGKLTGLNDRDDTFSSMVPHIWNWYSGVKTSLLYCQEDQESIGKKICHELGISHRGLTKYGCVNFDCVASALVQNKLFHAEDWYSEILLFPSSWYENENNPAWQPFYDEIKQLIWLRSKLWRFRWAWDGLLTQCVNNDESPLTVSFVKHLISIACGSLTSFAQAGEAELPYNAFKEFFENIFGSKYTFEVLCAKPFNYKISGTQGFVPLLPDMLLDYIPTNMSQYNSTSEKENIKNLFHSFFRHLSKNDLLQDTPLSNIKDQVEFIFDNEQKNYFDQSYVTLRARQK